MIAVRIKAESLLFFGVLDFVPNLFKVLAYKTVNRLLASDEANPPVELPPYVFV